MHLDRKMMVRVNSSTIGLFRSGGCMPDKPATRDALIEAFNKDLSREYQAIIAYVVYSQALKGAQYMSVAKELEKHAAEELRHALTIAKHVDYLGGIPTNTPQPVKLSNKPAEMLRADLK